MNKELDIGNIEYKRFIHFSTPKRQGSLISQLKFRLKEGTGYCIYYIGLEDDGKIYPIDNQCFEKSIENLKFMCKEVNAQIVSIKNKIGVKNEWQNDNNNLYYEVKICDIIPSNEYRILNI
jgi:GTPase